MPPVLEAARPLLQLGLAVVPAPSARAVVEAHERPVRREHVSLEVLHLWTVADHERGAVRAQQLVDGIREPARVAELEAVAPGRKGGERRSETVVVALERRGQLPQDRAELR